MAYSENFTDIGEWFGFPNYLEDYWKDEKELNGRQTIEHIRNLNENSSEAEWVEVFERVKNSAYYGYYGYICNDCEKVKKFPSKRWTFLHHMAHYNAPMKVVNLYKEKMKVLSLKDGDGKLAYDHVSENQSDEYKKLYKPEYRIANIDLQKLKAIEKQFHAVINCRVSEEVEKYNLVLPDLHSYREKCFKERMFYEIPHWHGGFTSVMHFDECNNLEYLEVTSLIRTYGGSGQKHQCFEDRWVMTEKDFYY